MMILLTFRSPQQLLQQHHLLLLQQHHLLLLQQHPLQQHLLLLLKDGGRAGDCQRITRRQQQQQQRQMHRRPQVEEADPAAAPHPSPHSLQSSSELGATSQMKALKELSRLTIKVDHRLNTTPLPRNMTPRHPSMTPRLLRYRALPFPISLIHHPTIFQILRRPNCRDRLLVGVRVNRLVNSLENFPRIELHRGHASTTSIHCLPRNASRIPEQ